MSRSKTIGKAGAAAAATLDRVRQAGLSRIGLSPEKTGLRAGALW